MAQTRSLECLHVPGIEGLTRRGCWTRSGAPALNKEASGPVSLRFFLSPGEDFQVPHRLKPPAEPGAPARGPLNAVHIIELLTQRLNKDYEYLGMLEAISGISAGQRDFSTKLGARNLTRTSTSTQSQSRTATQDSLSLSRRNWTRAATGRDRR